MANTLDVRIDLPSDAELEKMFAAVPALERHKVGDAVVRAGAKVIAKRAKSLTPRNKTKDEWPRLEAQATDGTDWDYPLWKTIKYVVRKYNRGAAAAFIGPAWPKGNKAYFNTSPEGRTEVIYGRVTGKTIPPVRNWIVQAFDETRSDQLAAMKVALSTKMRDIWE